MNVFKKLCNLIVNHNSSLEDLLFVHSPVPIIVTDDNREIVMVNSAFGKLFGYSPNEVIGDKMDLFKTGRQDHQFCKERWQKIVDNGSYEGEIWSRCKDGSERLLLEKVQQIRDHKKNYYLYMLEDVTESRKLVERYRYLAMHDALTGLANRSLAKDRFSHALVNSVRAGEKLGVLLCDLNEFKQVNDVYGHHVGDMLLIEIGKKLTESVRGGDTVARIGGDEFLIIVERLETVEELQELAKKIHKQLQTSFEIDGYTIDARVSIGDACSPQDGLNYETMLKVADHKMYNEKERYYGYL